MVNLKEINLMYKSDLYMLEYENCNNYLDRINREGKHIFFLNLISMLICNTIHFINVDIDVRYFS